MKTAFRILARDLKALAKNPIALLVVGALLVLPGLYAWYCIIANWDPYSNTGRVPVAVVNLDEGAKSDVAGDVDVGAQVVEGLRENDSIDWRFYDDEEAALRDTRDAVCYATIVFPSDLSRNIVGILEGSDDPPLVYYYPNEKYNAVATKVTDSAAQTLVRQVNQQFSSTVNETILARVQGAADDAEERASGVSKSAIAEMRSVRKDVAGVLESLDDAASSIEGWRTAASGAQGTLAGIGEQLPVIKKALSRGGSDLETLQEKTDEFGGTFAQGLVDSGTALASLSAQTSAAVGTASVDVSAIAGAIDVSIVQLETIADSLLDDDALKDVRNEIDSTLDKLRSASSTVSDAVERASETTKRMNSTVKETTAKSSAAGKEFTLSILPNISSGTSQLSSALSGLSGAMGQFEPQMSELSSVLSQADAALERATTSIDDAKVLLADVSEHLNSTVGDLSSLGSALQIERLQDVLDVDPDNLGQFVSSPVQLVTEKIFPVSNYGTAVAPFYTNLALWIGCFILVSLMKVEVAGFRGASTQQRYFGRWLLFVILSLLQSQVICGVDILLGIDCANPAAFMAAGALCSFAYMNLIYALVITFRNVGKTLCILLLIMQVPGSSGMYPIQMMPGFFQFIHPALPFTYGIDAMREALCGMYGNAYPVDLGVLALIVPVSLAVGLALRPYLMNFLVIFDEEMRKTGFFASEEHGQAGDGERMRALFKALASHDAYRDDMEERAWKFNRRYPRLRRIGSIAAFAIPFAFLVALMPANAVLGQGFGINLKLGLLVAMLVVLLIVLVGLIVLEYAHRTIEQETRMLGEELMSYSTLFDQAEDVRSAVEEQMDELRDELRDAAEQRVEELRESVGKHAAVAREKAEHASSEAVAMVPLVRKDGKDGKRRGVHAVSGAGRQAGAKAARAGAHAASAQGPSSSARSSRAARKRRHGVAGYIFRTDMRLGFQSVIGVVVIMLLVITPSLYAWFNIAGSWDPYANTGGLKVGVANVDEGYKGDVVPVRVNVGDTVVAQLRGNSSFDWVFESEEDCVEGVRSGEYYAAIVIPKDFSRNLLTYLVDDADYPDVVYYTNEKENPIAPIITQKGASSIQESIRASFTQRIDEVVLTVGQDLVGYATQPRVSGYAQKMSGHLDDATHDMGTGATELESLSDLSKTVAGVIDTAGTALDGVHEAGQSAKSSVSAARSGAKSALAAFDEAAALVKDLAPDGDEGLDGFKSDVDYALQLMQDGSAKAPGVLSSAAEKVGDWVELLETVEEVVDDAAALLDDGAESDDAAGPEAAEDASDFSLAPMVSALKKLKASLETAASNSSGTSGSIAEAREELSALFDDAEKAVSDASGFYSESVQPAAGDLKDTMAQVSDSAGSVVEGIEDMVTGLSGSTGGLSSQLSTLSDGFSGSGGKLKSAAKRITDAKQRLADALESGDAKKLAQVLLGNDTTLMSQRLAEPVQQDRQAMYAVSNYGSSMAPFYTVLSLWVGALVMVSTMRAHVEEGRAEELRQRFARVRPRHEYFGRYGIFGFISLLQSLLVLLGDMLFLNIQCVHPVLFLLLGVFVGQVFCLIVYTLTELFGDVGKAVCVILLIMQVAASGGTFPVEMLDPLLSQLVPFLPFYHAMSLLQECVAGMNVLMAAVNVMALLATIGGMLLIGVVVRRPFRKLNDFFEAQLEKTGYM